MPRYTHDPNDVLDYPWDWFGTLTAGETISTAEFFADPSDLTIASSSHTDTNATAWLTGGTLGQSYTVTNRITTNQGRTYEWSATINCRQR